MGILNVSEIRKELIWKFGNNRILVHVERESLNITVARRGFIEKNRLHLTTLSEDSNIIVVV